MMNMVTRVKVLKFQTTLFLYSTKMYISMQDESLTIFTSPANTCTCLLKVHKGVILHRVILPKAGITRPS